MSSVGSSAVGSVPSLESSEQQPSSTTAKERTFNNFHKSFRSFVSSLIVASKQAEKVAAATSSTDAKEKKTAKDVPLDDAVELLLKQRQSVRQSATLLEGKIRGNVKGSEALQCCLKSQPCVAGGRKRKFSLMNSDAIGKEAS